MEKVEGTARPDWLPVDKQTASVSAKSAPAAKAVPWRTPGAAPKPAPKPQPAAVVAPAAARSRPRHRFLETHVLPLLFLAAFVLVVGGYLSGWHLG